MKSLSRELLGWCHQERTFHIHEFTITWATIQCLVLFCMENSIRKHFIIVECWAGLLNWEKQDKKSRWDKWRRVFSRIWVARRQEVANVLFLIALTRSLKWPQCTSVPGTNITELALAYAGPGLPIKSNSLQWQALPKPLSEPREADLVVNR